MSKPKTLADSLAEQAVPLADKSSLKIDVAEIPLPPADLVDDLDNASASPEPDASPESVTLDFCGDEMPYAEFPLKYPFRWEGVRVDRVTVRQLTTAEVGGIATRMASGGKLDVYEVYAAMAGLPAKVLRALPAVDGEPIMDKAFDFLPRLFRAADG